MRRAAPALAALLAVALAGCADDEPVLPGERVPMRAAAPGAAEAGGESPGDPAAPAEIRAIPAAGPPAPWTQAGGTARRAGGHLPAPSSLSLAWSAEVGAARTTTSSRAGPVVADGRAFVRDGETGVHAVDAASGRAIWSVDLAPEGEDPASGYGGGLALLDGRLFAATGFGEIAALSPADGEVLWRARADAPFRAPPAADQGVIVAVTRAHVAIAWDAATGEELWREESPMSRPGALAGAAPAMGRDVALLPFGTGEMQLTRLQGGLRIWSGVVISPASAEGLAAFPDITSAPAIGAAPDGSPVVVTGNAGGAFAAFEGPTGRRLWQRDFGALSPAWVADGTLFLATTEPALRRLDLMTGASLWTVPLAAWEDPEDEDGPIAYAGPVLAGGRLLTASSDGRLLSHDPQTGAAGATVALPAGATSAPAVAEGAVFVQTDDGRLLAYR